MATDLVLRSGHGMFLSFAWFGSESRDENLKIYMRGFYEFGSMVLLYIADFCLVNTRYVFEIH